MAGKWHRRATGESSFVIPNSPLRGIRMIMLQQSLEMGGAERQGLLLARWLKECHGADIEVWGLEHSGAAAAYCENQGIPWRLVPWDWRGSRREMLTGLLRLLLALRQARPDVLLPYTMPPNIACGLFWRWVGARTCIWNQRDEGRQRFWPWLESRAVRNTPWFVSNSFHASDFLVEKLGVHHPKVEVIHNGIEMAPPVHDRTVWRARLGISAETFVACMVANLHAFKDHSTLLRAWRLVKDSSGTIHPILLLAGRDDGIGAGLLAMVEQLDLSEQVRFLGHVQDIPGLLKASDIGVFSSLKEGVPNGVLECMAAGLPVVATDIPGIREALGADNEQFLAEEEDPPSLAGPVLRFLHDQDLRQSVGQRNLERVREEFSKERMFARYYEIFCRTLA